MNAVPFEFDVAGAKTSAIFYPAASARATLVLAHGAGAGQNHPFMVGIARALSAREIDVVTFAFLYTHVGRRLPDKNDVLEATWGSAIDAVRARSDVAKTPFFIGGKSMGGRIATQVAAKLDPGDLAGLVLLGYPLHPPGKPEQLRSAHLPRVRAPMLFVQGSNDTFGKPDELAPIVASLASRVPATRLFVVTGGDHSLAVRREPTETSAGACGRAEIARFCLESPPRGWPLPRRRGRARRAPSEKGSFRGAKALGDRRTIARSATRA